MTEKRYNARRNEDNDDYRARLKAELEDVIGIVHTDEVTDSVELKKEYYKNQSKDKQYTYLNYSRDGYIGSFYENDKPLTNKEVYDLLNGQEELIKRLKTIREEQTETILKQKRKIKELETRNKRQYNRLKELTELMYERQWGKLENMVEEWEKQEELLQAEYGSYGDNV